jgi:hypothetical protein
MCPVGVDWDGPACTPVNVSADGRFSFQNVPPGDYTIYVIVGAGFLVPGPSEQIDVRVGPGQQLSVTITHYVPHRGMCHVSCPR